MSGMALSVEDEKLNTDVIEIYADDIELYLSEYCQSRGIEDPYNMKSTQWAAALQMIGNRLFKPNRQMLTIPEHKDTLDLAIVDRLIDKYILLCYDHNQRISIQHFCFLSGIDKSTIYQWLENNTMQYIYIALDGSIVRSRKAIQSGKYKDCVTIKSIDLYQKLVNNAIEIADDILLTKSGVNSIAYRNAVQERYNTRRQDQQKSYDAGNIALQLGITDKLASLPDHDGK